MIVAQSDTGAATGAGSDPARLLEQLGRASRIAFDLDGTLYDTRDYERPALAAVAHWLREKSGEPLDGLTEAFWARRETDRHRPGLFDALLAKHSLPIVWGRECIQIFHGHAGDELACAQSLQGLLRQLCTNGARLALVSNGQRELQERKVSRLGLQDVFDVRVYCDPGKPQQLKPSSWAWAQLEGWRGAIPAVYVGDDPVDAGFANAGNARFIAFRFRSSSYED